MRFSSQQFLDLGLGRLSWRANSSLLCRVLLMGIVAQLFACSDPGKVNWDGEAKHTPGEVDPSEFANPAPNSVNLSENVSAADVEAYLAKLEKYINEEKRPDAARSPKFAEWLANAPALTGLASTGSFDAPDLDRNATALGLAGQVTQPVTQPVTVPGPQPVTQPVTQPAYPSVPLPPGVVDPLPGQIIGQPGPRGQRPPIVLPRPLLPGNNGFRGRIVCNQFSIWGQCCNPLNGGGAFTDMCFLRTSLGMQCTASRGNRFNIMCPRLPLRGERIVQWYCPPRDLNACPI